MATRAGAVIGAAGCERWPGWGAEASFDHELGAILLAMGLTR